MEQTSIRPVRTDYPAGHQGYESYLNAVGVWHKGQSQAGKLKSKYENKKDKKENDVPPAKG